MYIESQPVLYTTADPVGFESWFTLLPTNGRYIRSHRGTIVGTREPNESGIIYLGEHDGKEFRGVITDPLLVTRITTYLCEYYGERFTNCSAFAHYVLTGEFIACEEKHNLAVVGAHMRPFTSKKPVSVGDVVCLVYMNKWYARSRLNTQRSAFLKVQKARHRTGTFTEALSMRSKTHAPDAIRDLCKSDLIGGYHFMVCVDRHEGEPVWLSQQGYHLPGEEPTAFALTKGWRDTYPEQTPMYVFIKRRR